MPATSPLACAARQSMSLKMSITPIRAPRPVKSALCHCAAFDSCTWTPVTKPSDAPPSSTGTVAIGADSAGRRTTRIAGSSSSATSSATGTRASQNQSATSTVATPPCAPIAAAAAAEPPGG
ncbi:MAG: hypothetical protein R2695_16590 [Acidimicrobiales bacterium]